MPDDADAATRRVLGGALEEVYQSVDAAFGRVLAALPEGTDLVVTSPVGMDVNTSRADLLPEMLDAVLSGGPRGRGRPAPGSCGGCARRCRRACARRWPARCRTGSRSALTERLELRGLDWTATRAFAHPPRTRATCG